MASVTQKLRTFHRFTFIHFVFVLLLHPIHSLLNQHIQYTDSDGAFLWESTSDFMPLQSTAFGNMTIGRIMSMSFDFVWNGFISTEDTSTEWFFRVGADARNGGNGCNGNQHRYPALSIISLSGSPPFLRFYLSEQGDCNREVDLDSIESVADGIEEGTLYRFAASWNSSTLSVSINGEGQKWSRNQTAAQYIGELVPVWWMSNKFGNTEYKRANGTFSNITIRSLVSYHDEQSPPPTTERTFSPVSSSSSSSSSPTPSPTAYVVVDGQIEIESTPSSSSRTDSDHDSDRIDDDEANAESSNSPLISIMIAVVAVALCSITIAALSWRYRVRQREKESMDDLEIKHFSMINYLGTGHNGEVSPPSTGGTERAFQSSPGRPRNMQNLPDLPMSPPMSPGNEPRDDDRDRERDEDDMKSPFLDDELEDMYPEKGKAQELEAQSVTVSEREGIQHFARSTPQPPTPQALKPIPAETRGRGTSADSIYKRPSLLPNAVGFAVIKSHSVSGSESDGDEGNEENEERESVHPFVITVGGVDDDPDLSSNEEIVDNIDDDVIHVDDANANLRVQQSDDLQSNLSDHEVVDGDLWTDGE